MFGIDIIDAGLIPSMLIALIAGIFSFLSPCVLPIVPPYLAYMGGISMQKMENDKSTRRHTVTCALFFTLGLSTVFILLGIAVSALGQFMLQNQDWFGRLSGLVIILFGLHFIGLIKIPFLYNDLRVDAGDRGGNAFGAYILGLAFAFGWTPCIGPILGTILSLAAQEASFTRSSILMALYAIGLGVPFILAAVFINNAMRVMKHFKRHMRKVEISMGIMLVLIGITLISGSFSAISFWLLENLPFLAAIG
ncbi:cytochrome c biogenesis protein CcdA [Amylibacter sp.]|nr:cytochrome c biogenesis protein CcdA [Amylibacter sp.]